MTAPATYPRLAVTLRVLAGALALVGEAVGAAGRIAARGLRVTAATVNRLADAAATGGTPPPAIPAAAQPALTV